MFGAVSRRTVLIDLGCTAALLALVWSAYAPSLKHSPRCDQWCFLVETMDQHTFPDTFARTYSYNRNRGFAPGDTDLFRPILFGLLSAEKVAFGPDLGGPQVVGLLLHCGICLLLLILFRQIAKLCEQPSDDGNTPPRSIAAMLLPYAVVGFFALNPGVQELVIWGHLHGYLLFLVFLLGSLALLIRHASGPTAGSWRSPCLWAGWGFAFLSAFTYELGQCYAVLAGLFLAAAVCPKVGRTRAAGLFALFASVLLVYQLVNAIDMAAHEGSFVPEHNQKRILNRIFTPPTVEHSARFAVYTTLQPFFPSLITTSYSGERMQIAESLWTRHGRRNLGPAAWVSAVVVLLAAGLGAVGLVRLSQQKQRLPLLLFLLAVGLYGLYAALTVLGRMNLRPVANVLTSNCYYTYTALLFGLLAGYVGWAALPRHAACVNARTGLLVGLLTLAMLGGEQVRRVNQNLREAMGEVSRPIRATHTFVRQHRDEPDFSFQIDYEASDPVPRRCGIPVTDILFAKWMPDREEPKYRVAFREGTVIVLSPGPRPHPQRPGHGL